mmetsp:Transcript_2655/g.7057  ORF Transcript_2655/g.7057 Transcript_2655/m.7057 type:complete len:323 (-) Transcript_2655:263-1231(-)
MSIVIIFVLSELDVAYAFRRAVSDGIHLLFCLREPQLIHREDGLESDAMVLFGFEFVEGSFQTGCFRRHLVFVKLQNGVAEFALGVSSIVLQGGGPVVVVVVFVVRFAVGITVTVAVLAFRVFGITEGCLGGRFQRAGNAQCQPGEVDGRRGQQARVPQRGCVRHAPQFQQVVGHVPEDGVAGRFDAQRRRRNQAPGALATAVARAGVALGRILGLGGAAREARPQKLKEELVRRRGLEKVEIDGVADAAFHALDLFGGVDVVRHVGNLRCLGRRHFLDLAGQPDAGRPEQLIPVPLDDVTPSVLGHVVLAVVVVVVIDPVY